MAVQFVTCISVGVYSHALSRGKSYEVYKFENNKYRLEGDHGKRIWIQKDHFVEGIEDIPSLISWKFDDEINQLDFIEISLKFTDGSKRWSIVTTPEKLANYFNKSNEVGFSIENLNWLSS